MSGQNGRRSRRISDVPVPLDVDRPVMLPKKPMVASVSPTDDEVWKSKVAALIRSTNPDFYDLLDLARSPLPTIEQSEAILASAAERGDLDESIEPLVAAGIGAWCSSCGSFVQVDARPSYMRRTSRAFCEICAVAKSKKVGNLVAVGALTAAGPPSAGRGVWIEGPYWLTASAYALPRPSKTRRGARRSRMGRRLSRPGRSTEGE